VRPSIFDQRTRPFEPGAGTVQRPVLKAHEPKVPATVKLFETRKQTIDPQIGFIASRAARYLHMPDPTSVFFKFAGQVEALLDHMVEIKLESYVGFVNGFENANRYLRAMVKISRDVDLVQRLEMKHDFAILACCPLQVSHEYVALLLDAESGIDKPGHNMHRCAARAATHGQRRFE
jgi:hypothetical protein